MFFRRELKRMTYDQLVEDAKNNDITNWSVLYEYSKNQSLRDILKFNTLCKRIIKTSSLPKYDSLLGIKLKYGISSFFINKGEYNIETGKVLKGFPIIFICEKSDYWKPVDTIEWSFFRWFE